MEYKVAGDFCNKGDPAGGYLVVMTDGMENASPTVSDASQDVLDKVLA